MPAYSSDCGYAQSDTRGLKSRSKFSVCCLEKPNSLFCLQLPPLGLFLKFSKRFSKHLRRKSSNLHASQTESKHRRLSLRQQTPASGSRSSEPPSPFETLQRSDMLPCMSCLCQIQPAFLQQQKPLQLTPGLSTAAMVCLKLQHNNNFERRSES